MTFHDSTATQVTNITLNVANLTKMTQFYTEVLGLTLASKDDALAILNIGNSGHTVTLRAITDAKKPAMSEAGLFHIAFLVPIRADLANFLYHAASLGIQAGGGDHLVSEALYLSDIEGNGIEVYQDRDATTWQWEDDYVKMDTLQVDAEDLVNQRTTEGWQGMPSQSKLGHLHLKTANLESARNFYITQLGLQHISHYPQALFMSTNQYHHHIAVNVWQSTQPRLDNDHSLGLYHIDIYKPNAQNETSISPEGFSVTVHSNRTTVPE